MYNNNSNSNSRNWGIVGNFISFGDFSIVQSTQQGGNPFYSAANSRLYIAPNGNVGINTTDPANALSVNGTVQAKEVLVNTNWSDYVFAPDYHLRSLKDTAAYIEQNHHLPDIPSAAEVKQKGVGVGEMESKLLAKIEELTLHMIQAEQRNQELQERIARLEAGAAK